jgi:predicted phosphodiesterase
MNIALFSDIHANLPALQAFFKDVDSRNPEAIYCLGDLVGYNIWANEVVNEIKNFYLFHQLNNERRRKKIFAYTSSPYQS